MITRFSVRVNDGLLKHWEMQTSVNICRWNGIFWAWGYVSHIMWVMGNNVKQRLSAETNLETWLILEMLKIDQAFLVLGQQVDKL